MSNSGGSCSSNRWNTKTAKLHHSPPSTTGKGKGETVARVWQHKRVCTTSDIFQKIKPGSRSNWAVTDKTASSLPSWWAAGSCFSPVMKESLNYAFKFRTSQQVLKQCIGSGPNNSCFLFFPCSQNCQ